MSTMVYERVLVAGTFDHLHPGHQALLKFAAKQGKTLLIGLGSDALCKHKAWAQTLQPFALRKQELQSFLHGAGIQANIFSLDSVVGPAGKEVLTDALVVTSDTRAGGEAVNVARKKANLPELPLILFPLLTNKQDVVISSTRIRQGELDQHGQPALSVVESLQTLSPAQRSALHAPFGPVVTQPSTSSVWNYVIGDIVLDTFHTHGWPYVLGVYDLHSQRSAVESDWLHQLKPSLRVSNPAGGISSALCQALTLHLNQTTDTPPDQPFHVLVEGEEDLTAVVVLLRAPLGSYVYYGQPNTGMIEVAITLEFKEKLIQLLQPSATAVD